jgi:hypothetical protein
MKKRLIKKKGSQKKVDSIRVTCQKRLKNPKRKAGQKCYKTKPNCFELETTKKWFEEKKGDVSWLAFFVMKITPIGTSKANSLNAWKGASAAVGLWQVGMRIADMRVNAFCSSGTAASPSTTEDVI